MNKTEHDCPFCNYFDLQNESWIAEWEPFPVGIGHVKLIPKRHDATMITLTVQEEMDFFELFKRTIDYLDTAFVKHKPDGYNLGINMGEVAGQTIGHLHVHIIPRYKGDVENPRGGVRNIKPALVGW